MAKAVHSTLGQGPEMLDLQVLRDRLVGVTKRSRLINTPFDKGSETRRIDVLHADANELFDQLVRREKPHRFVPASGGHPDHSDMESVNSERSASISVPRRRVGILHTRSESALLHRKLTTIFRDVVSEEQESGVNPLFLAIGFLRWFDSESSSIPLYGPLILIPTELTRTSVTDFKLCYRDEDPTSNLALRQRLINDFQVQLPEIPDDDDWNPSDYFRLVSQATAHESRWSVEPNRVAIGHFAYTTQSMYEDLDPDNEWTDEGTKWHQTPIIQKLFTKRASGSVAHPASSAHDSTSRQLDREFSDPQDLAQVLDADASQTRVISLARDGRDLVVQGPPGTGKSQTIANMIGALVMDGKKVLFVAEKKAALDVVHHRLVSCELGQICLELHSHKANRKAVYEELRQTWDLTKPEMVEVENYQQLKNVRDELNRINDLLHARDDRTSETPYLVMGRISQFMDLGISRPSLHLEGADIWDDEEHKRKLELIKEFAQATESSGTEPSSVWHGVEATLSPLDRMAVHEKVEVTRRAAEEFISTFENVNRKGIEIQMEGVSVSHDGIEPEIAQLERLKLKPTNIDELLARDSFRSHSDEAHNLCILVECAQLLQEALGQSVEKDAFDLDWTPDLQMERRYGNTVLRMLKGPYRRTSQRLKGVCKNQPPKRHAERLQLLKDLNRLKDMCESIDNRRNLGEQCFGLMWAGIDSRLERIKPGVEWVQECARYLGNIEAVYEQAKSVGQLSSLDFDVFQNSVRSDFNAFVSDWDGLVRMLELDIGKAFDATGLQDFTPRRVLEKLSSWKGERESLENYLKLRDMSRRLVEEGLSEIVKGIGQGSIHPDHAVPVFRVIRDESLLKRLQNETPRLRRFSGSQRSRLVEQFRERDASLSRLAIQEVALKHYESIPREETGQFAIIRGEISKRARHLRIRQLLDRAGEAVQTIKPVFLMSPISVSQFIKPGSLTFDTLIFDEASQVTPTHAIGACLRAQQLIVVGDQQQLPPTSFFEKRQSESEDDTEFDADEIEQQQLGDMESILSLCEARGVQREMLKWHYRSEHPSLIQCSNVEFYNNELIFPPSPETSDAPGLKFTYVDQGQFDRGSSKTNKKEAREIVEALLHLVRDQGDHSVGVVALSIAQRDLVLDLLDDARREHPELDSFCNEENKDPMFVKNLENVQGDERDVILISVGYGPDVHGKIFQNFGPITQEGGERRLNVLFTRARKQCRVFSSLRHSDIQVEGATYRGRAVLKRFLRYAETRELDIPIESGREPDSPFEISVKQALERRGYEVVSQVSSAGFFIDLAVRNPERPGSYVLAVECDGQTYHSASWARERDRQRQEVLERMGWKFHRIWSTDWFETRYAEESRLIEAVERAKSEAQIGRRNHRAEKAMKPVISRSAKREVPESHPRYKLSEYELPYGSGEFKDATDRSVEEVITKVLRTEGPMHEDECVRRVFKTWDAGTRIGTRAKERLKGVLARMERAHEIVRWPDAKEFVDLRTREREVVLRDRSDSPQHVRSLKHVPPQEIHTTLPTIVRLGISVSTEGCVQSVSKRLGFQRTPSGLASLVEGQLLKLEKQGKLRHVNGKWRLAEP